ncbi:MAG: imidazole glycerol phosphate synthase subunit HisH [Eubacteriales bacterium]|nr:imidazole glycerol phosphate synthase subunit HisH [Eubacteriales bacterium]MDD4474328.1 imidazole glycerol phosphate synthase subunit HisH [Eubacteriales bacterium]
MTVILDYDMGNVCSIQNMLKKIGEKAIISRNPDIITNADKLILPGVGSYDMGMEQLKQFNLIEQIKIHAIDKQKPILGICLGMQLLGRRSEEGNKQGLSLIPFDVVKFNFDCINVEEKGLKIPHMGWDYTQNTFDDVLTDNLDERQRYYFVHSYYAMCDDTENSLMSCKYGYLFTAAVKKGRIYGVQFHPEKSHNFGMKLLQNFVQRV